MCALFGWLDYKGKISNRLLKKFTQALANAAEERGTDAAGISYIRNGRVTIYKRPKPAHKLHFHVPVGTTALMGHTRFTTQGDQKFNYNNHPFRGHAGTDFAFAHNGVLYNDVEIRTTKKLPETKIETDSYVAVQLLEKAEKLNFDSLRTMAETVRGNFTFTVLDEENTLYFVKGSNPLYLICFEELGLYAYASTKSIMEHALKSCGMNRYPYTVIATDTGDILSINRLGTIARDSFQAFSYGWFDDAYTISSKKHLEKEDTELDVILEMCTCFGVEPDEIMYLLDWGYSYDEIEEFLMYPDLIREELETIDEI